MKVMEYVQKISSIGKSTEQKQNNINVSEVWNIFDLLVSRYDIITRTQVLKFLTADKDLKMVINEGLETLQNQVSKLEDMMKKYGIPLPKRPPKEGITTSNVEEVTDEYVFRTIFKGIQAFILVEAKAFTSSSDCTIRAFFGQILNEELKMYDRLYEYGKVKGFIIAPPKYKA